MTVFSGTMRKCAGKSLLVFGAWFLISLQAPALANQSANRFLGPPRSLPVVKQSKVTCLKKIADKYQERYIFKTPKIPEKALDKFFSCFPQNWNGFFALFGFSEKDNKLGPFSNETGNYLVSTVLPMTRNVVGESRYEHRLIKLAMEARPQNFADGATDLNGAFFAVIYQEVHLHPEAMLKKLDSYDNDALNQFWFWTLIWKNYGKLESEICSGPKNGSLKACKSMGQVITEYHYYLEAN